MPRSPTSAKPKLAADPAAHPAVHLAPHPVARPAAQRSPRTNDPEAVTALIRALAAPLRALAERGTVRPYRKGALIIEEGSSGDLMYLVLQGHVRVFSSDLRGREIVYGVYGSGEYFGEMSLDHGPRSASVMALETTVCAVLTRQTLREHITLHPDFAFELMERIIHRARVATLNARNMALLDVYGRVAQLLNSIASTQADGTRVVAERLTHAEIAARVGSSREMVSRLLKDLERGGYVAVQARQYVLLRKLPPRW
jgi:CRP/FNR family transcriptional regulator, cyclic AMP receptor protein